MEFCERALKRGVFAQAIRPPTVPDGQRAPAPVGDGDSHAAASCAGRRASWPLQPARPALEPSEAEPIAFEVYDETRHPTIRAGCLTFCGRAVARTRDARPVRHGHRHRDRQDSRRFGDRRHAGRSRRARGRLQAGGDRSRRAVDDAPPDHELLRASAHSAPAPRRGRSLPLRPRRLTASGGASWPAWQIDARAAGRGRVRAAEGADALIVEGVGGLPVPLSRELPGARLRPRPRAARRDRGAPGAWHDQPHAADGRVRARSAASMLPAVVLTRWPDEPSEVELSNRETVAALAESRSRRSAPLYTGPPDQPRGRPSGRRMDLAAGFPGRYGAGSPSRFRPHRSL